MEEPFSFVQKGEGQDLVFLHGYLSSKEAFSAQIEYFSKFYRVSALDFLGFGASPALKEPYSVDDYAEWTRNALRALNVKKPHLIAHSFGCRVAVKLLANHGDEFSKSLLTGAAGVNRKRGLSYRVKVKTYRLVKRWFPTFAERKFGSEEYRSLSPVMKESYKKIVNEDLRSLAEKIENEVLLVQGKDDQTTREKEVREYLVRLKRGKMVQMDGGHFAFLEHPLAFNVIAEEFLDDGKNI